MAEQPRNSTASVNFLLICVFSLSFPWARLDTQIPCIVGAALYLLILKILEAKPRTTPLPAPRPHANNPKRQHHQSSDLGAGPPRDTTRSVNITNFEPSQSSNNHESSNPSRIFD